MKLAAFLLIILSIDAEAGTYQRFGRNFVVLYPSGDGTVTNWTKNTTNYYEAVDDTADASASPSTDGDTTYLDAPKTVASSAIFDLTNSSAYAGSDTKIRYVTLIFQGKRNNDSGSGTLLTQLDPYWRISSTEYALATNAFTTTSYANNAVSFTKSYTNPATSLPWTASDVDALQLTIKRACSGCSFRFDLRLTAIAAVVSYDRVPDSMSIHRIHGTGN